MSSVICEMIDCLIKHLDDLKVDLEGDLLLENASVRICAIPDVLSKIQETVPKQYLEDYNEYFESTKIFYGNCKSITFLDNNIQQAYDSIVLLGTCLTQVKEDILSNQGKCACCGNIVEYYPLSSYYDEMSQKYGSSKWKSETLNKDKYTCPKCGSSDRDRLIVSYLKKIGLPTALEGTRVLQIAPAQVIDMWIKKWCPNVVYDTTDLFMDGVTFKSDIQDMHNVESRKYDVIICSHVLEHVKDDKKALSEMNRILKDDGEIVFLVPIDLNRDTIDEEWGLSEEENWRRFGQDDHCRAYSKQGLLERLNEHFHVNQLGKGYFGEEVFGNAGLTDTSTLYVLTKDETVRLYKGWIPEIDEELCQNGPLVSVILPCYNHEKYVARAIESIINQSYKNIELIVCDDGSSDNTPSIMKKYSEYFAKAIYYPENIRIRDQVLAKEATGKYVALAHSDDYWEKDKLALQIAWLEKNGGVCLTWADYVDDYGNVQEDAIFYKRNRSSKEWLRYFWTNGNCLCNPSCVMEREVFIKSSTHGISSKQLPDYFKWIDIVQQYELHIVPLPLTKMGVHYDGKSVNDSAPTKDNSLRSLLEDGIHWLYVLEDMPDNVFVEAFEDMFVNRKARSKEELMCERYFMLRDSQSIVRANSALYYMARYFPMIQNCLKDKYGYKKTDFFIDEMKKGILSLTTSN